MLTYKGHPIRRIQTAWPESRTGSAMYSIELWDTRATYLAPAVSIGADGGIAEILYTARFRAGQILEKPDDRSPAVPQPRSLFAR